MTGSSSSARQVAGKVRRLVRRNVARRVEPRRQTQSGVGSGRTHRIVLVAVTPAEANAFLRAGRVRPTGPMPTVIAARDLKEKDQRVESGEITVVARSLADLRQVMPWLIRAGRSAHVTLGVVETTRPRLLRAPTVVTGTEVTRVERHQVAGSGVALSVRLAGPVPVRDVLRTVLQEPRPAGRAAPSAGLRLGVTAYDALAFAAGDPTAHFVGPKTTVAREVEHEVIDFLVGPVVHPQPDPRIVHLSVSERLWLPPVDTSVLSPVGFRREAAGVGAVRISAGEAPTLSVSGPDGALSGARDARSGLTENQIESLRGWAGVEVTGDADAALLGRALSQLACAGVPVRPLPLTPELAGALGEDLAARFAVDWDPADPTDRESWSVATRRLALRRFAPEAYWGDLARRHARPSVAPPSISVLVPTRRADFLPFVLAQIERQDYPDFETVLVLHGLAADDPSVQKAIAGFSRPLVLVEVPAATVFGAALNAGVARCSGQLLTKMDDDDWYGPHHLTDLVLARAYSGATAVGLTGYHVYLHGSDTTIRWTAPPTEAPAGWLAGGTMLLGLEDVRGLGGWRATPSAVDWHLLASVRTAGGWLYATHDLGFLYYRGHDHTWSPAGDRGDAVWLERDPAPRAGFHPPPQLDPLTHPRVG
ncbi:glycosyltransferase family A protein [Sporichthya sp.]|uniref:glycosyltransferase family A protein n=1 Tax=Sporichthya sp. TaxID=65475 RepID=UPI0017E9E138|nr:glycosyltransferase family A protein [Sporichthya sp.]MBA3744307.1 glycosyltransferase [Sporichthya sp.]